MLVSGRRLAAVVLAGLVLSACSTQRGSGATAATAASGDEVNTVGVTTYPPGQRPAVPELTGPTLDGGSFTLSSLGGHVVVLNTWASWCGPCRSESPALARVAGRTSTLGVRFVGIDEQDDARAARTFTVSAGTTYPQLVDREGELLASLRLVPAAAVPSTLVLDREGHVAVRVVGPVNEAGFERLVRAVAATPVPTPSG